MDVAEAEVAETRTAKLFNDAAGQAVLLPAEFWFEGDEVFVSRDERTGDVVLSSRPGARVWRDFFDFMATIQVPPEFMVDRPMNAPPIERNIFSEED